MERKDAIEIIKKNWPDSNFTMLREALETLIPELSEDLRIIEAIKYGLDHVFINNTTVFEVTKEQCLAWLKKKGEQKPAWKPSDEQMKCISDVVADAKYRNNISTNGYEPYTHLSTLLQQLKKLKG